MRHLARFGIVGLMVMLITGAFQLINIVPVMAATIDDLTVTCQYVTVRGKTEVNTNFVRVQVVLGSNLTTVLAQEVVRTRPRAGASYEASLSIRKAHLAEGTHVVISVGEWDGTKYLRPATLIGVDCSRDGHGSPTPTFIPTSTLPPMSATPTFIPTSTIPPVSTTPTFVPSPTRPPVSATPTFVPSPTYPPPGPTPTPR